MNGRAAKFIAAQYVHLCGAHYRVHRSMLTAGHGRAAFLRDLAQRDAAVQALLAQHRPALPAASN